MTQISCSAPVVGVVIEAMSGIFAARDALIEEQAQLGPGTRGDSKKVENPTQLFLTLASILWMKETSRLSDEVGPRLCGLANLAV